MALHFDLQVNTETIGTFYARRLNKGTVGPPQPDSINAYEWSVKGAWTLVQSILGEVERQKQERIAYSLEA